MMAEIKLDSINSNFKEYTLKMSDGDRIKIELNGEYVTYMRGADGTLSYLKADNIAAI
jgi:hypothetical protein